MKYRRILIAGYFMLFILMSLLSLFIIAFSERADSKLSYIWMETSIVGILIDQILFELLAASVVAIIIITQKKVMCCKFFMIIAVLIELYRIYRNFSE